MQKKGKMLCTFIGMTSLTSRGIVNPKRFNIIAGAICRHPSMDLTDFNSNYLSKLLAVVREHL